MYVLPDEGLLQIKLPPDFDIEEKEPEEVLKVNELVEGDESKQEGSDSESEAEKLKKCTTCYS